MTIEIVDFPMNSMVDLSSSLCKRENQSVWPNGGAVCSTTVVNPPSLEAN